MLRYLTSGESHGRCLIAIVEGFPAGVRVDLPRVNEEMARRQFGYGRGGRQKIEQDEVQFFSGVRHGLTMGSPLALYVENKDFSIDTMPSVTRPRPGHADLSGAIKYDTKDIRNILERASARETAARVAVGALCKLLLAEFGIDVTSHIVRIGKTEASVEHLSVEEIKKNAASSPTRCADPKATAKMTAEIDEAGKKGDSLGGIFEVIATGCPVGLGSYVQYDRRLDARLASAIVSINAVKACEIGRGVSAAGESGSEVHDQIYFEKSRGFFRKTNSAGGIEGGMTNGMPVIVRGYMKPISTLGKPLASVDIASKEPFEALVERFDVCAVPAAGVIGEAMVAIELAKALQEKFGGDSLSEMKRHHDATLKHLKGW